MNERVLVAGFSHETNTYADEPTTREDFQERSEYVGQEIIDERAGTNTVIGGAIEVAENEGIDLVPVVSASATPGGLVSRETYEYYTDLIVEGAREHADEIDGVLLALHGAMVPEAEDGGIGDDGEGPLVEAVRNEVGDVPIVVTHDLHGNVTDQFLEVTDALVAYETYPHVDTGATGRKATELLLEIARGNVDPVMTVERPPVLAYGPRQNTREGPMAEVMARARELEHRDSILKVNVFPGFQAADVPSTGFSIPVVADGDEDAAREAARELAAEVWDRREQFVGDYPEPDEAVALAGDLASQRGDEKPPFDELPEVVDEGGDPDGPVVVADVGDNPGGGGAADETTVLRALLERGVENAGFALIRDPEAVEACAEAGVGERVALTLGGKTNDRYGEPIEGVDGYVKAITDGRFRNTGPMGTGTESRLGRTVRLHCRLDDDLDDPELDEAELDEAELDEAELNEAELNEAELDEAGVTVIVTENRLQPLDAEIWRHVGVQPERLDVLVVKSTNHFRADYEPMASYVIPVDSPGLAAMNPRRYDYERVRRPQFPLDEMDADAYPDW